MKTKVSPAIVGLFVLGAFALGLIALLSVGSLSLFSKPHRFMVYFDESIHGLDLGSPVKLRGVRVGRVVDLAVHYDDVANRSVVVVTCELSRNVITDEKGAQLKIAEARDIQTMVDHGLRAQLGVLGLALGFVHRGVGGGIDDHIRREALQRRGQAVEVTQVAAVIATFRVQRQHLAQRRQAALQFPADLAVFAEQEDLHARRSL